MNSRLPRTLGLFDLTMLLVIAVVNLNLVPVIAGAGSSALLLWAGAFVLFCVPQAIAVVQLSRLYPHEGGVYVWSKAAFGDFHGFMSGWCYWTNNILYVPTLLLYVVSFAAYVWDIDTHSANPSVMTIASLVLLWIIIALNITGYRASKWLQNLGAWGTLIIVAAVVALAFLASGPPVTKTSLIPAPTEIWNQFPLLGTACFAFVGLELGAVLNDEIKCVKWALPRAVIVASVVCVVAYFLCNFALQTVIPVADIAVIEGLLQALDQVLIDANVPALMNPLALLLCLSAAGAATAWLGASARLPFVMGLDRYLPAALGRLHARYQTPHVALIVQGVASTVMVLVSATGSTVRELYLILLTAAVIIQLIPFLYIFGALMKVTRQRRSLDGTKQSLPCYLAAGSGCAVTLLGIALCFVPPQGVPNAFTYELKLVFGCASMIVPAIFLYRQAKQQAHHIHPVALVRVTQAAKP
jgi:amino acid transporter